MAALVLVAMAAWPRQNCRRKVVEASRLAQEIGLTPDQQADRKSYHSAKLIDLRADLEKKQPASGDGRPRRRPAKRRKKIESVENARASARPALMILDEAGLKPEQWDGPRRRDW
jgi:hypothetical protein